MKQTENYTHYRPYLAQLFGEITDEQLKQVFSIAEVLHFDAGQYIFKEGDADNALYIVLTGRLRVLQQTDTGMHVLGDVAAGEPVGELALFTKDPRSASVVAIRKSTVLQIDEADYNALVLQNPQFAFTLTQFVIDRLKRNAFKQKMGAAPKNIAVIKLQSDHDFSAWTDDMSRELGIMGTHINIYDAKSPSQDNPNAVFEDMENSTGINILVCDNAHTVWAKQCLTYCDLVMVATEFDAQSALYPIEEQLNLYAADILNKKIYLVFLHPENAPPPSQTRRWFEGRQFDLHLHIRANNPKDIRRFCRILTHKAVGLVLGGGGAKGFAHVGVAKAMMEAGIEFDFVGGTSAGALLGIGLTFTDFDMPKLARLCQKGADSKVTSNDYNLPFISLMSGRKMRKLLHEAFGETYLEDIWVTCYTISTNYSTASLKVHETGLAKVQVEASIAIPGVFPPVIIDRHLHVDGGVMDNLPIEAMYQKPVSHVIAISLAAQSPHLVSIEKVPSAWELLVNKFTKKHRYRLPKMPSLLINSLTLNSVQKQAVAKSQVAIYLEMDLQKFGFLDWSKWEVLIEKGHSQTQDFLKKMPVSEQFWKKS
jgi:predicted acylesterase/phospholipase RssA/CRP-like cAMP-binding protein